MQGPVLIASETVVMLVGKDALVLQIVIVMAVVDHSVMISPPPKNRHATMLLVKAHLQTIYALKDLKIPPRPILIAQRRQVISSYQVFQIVFFLIPSSNLLLRIEHAQYHLRLARICYRRK